MCCLMGNGWELILKVVWDGRGLVLLKHKITLLVGLSYLLKKLVDHNSIKKLHKLKKQQSLWVLGNFRVSLHGFFY